MNLPAELPEWVYLLGMIVTPLTAWITVRFAKKDSPAIQRIDEQVSNTHDTNLRDDITMIAKDVRLIREEMLEMRKFDAHVLEWMSRGGAR